MACPSHSPAGRLPTVAIETLALAHGTRAATRAAFMEQHEQTAARAGVQLQWLGLIAGKLTGPGQAEAIRSALGERNLRKVGLAQLAIAQAEGWTAGLTVAAALSVCQRRDIQLLVTGGLGGVHAGQPADVSADLCALGRFPVAVVCAGFKPFIDALASLSVLDSLGVPMIGPAGGAMPCLFANDAGPAYPQSCPRDATLIAALGMQLAAGQAGCVVVTPVPAGAAMKPDFVARLAGNAVAAAQARGVTGGALTPFLMDHMHAEAGPALLEANEAALGANIERAIALAAGLAQKDRIGIEA